MQDVIDFNLLKEYDTTLKDILEIWAKQKAYSLGDKVKYKGRLLECTTAGTSGTTTLNFTGLDIGDTITDGTVVWELVEEESGKGIDFYTVGESYNVNDIVIYNGNIYQCITAHTSTSTFDNAKWEEISKNGIPYYDSGTSYKIDDQVVYNNKIYKCIMAHTSTSTFDSTKWEKIGDEVFTGATSSSSGEEGIVPQPTTSDISKFLCGDGTWKKAGGSGLYSNNYSTDEQEIGTWIDGKKLYQKTYSLMSPYTSDGRVELAELPVDVNAENVIAIDAIMTSNGGAFTPQWLSKTEDGYCIFVRPNRKIVCEVSGENKENKSLFVTIKYTKA